MPSFLTLQSVALATPDGRTLVNDLSLSFSAERTGLVGPNGAGKTTLLMVLAGQAHPASGQVTRAGSLGVLQQTWPDPAISVTAALGAEAGLSVLARIERGRASAADLDRADWTLPVRVAEALSRAGLPDDVLDAPVERLSGGQRTRVGIARLLLSAPDLLLLDEPTNNLDADGRALVTDLLADWPGGVVVASHDRALLERMDRILDLSPAGCTLHGGGWSAFAAAREARRARDAAALEQAERQLARTEGAIQLQREKRARREKVGRAKRAKGDAPKLLLDAQAQRAERSGGRDRRLARRLEATAVKAREAAARRVEVRPPLRIDAEAAKAHGVVLRFDTVVFRRGRFQLGPIDAALRAGEHVAIRGGNGAGKTTLLDLVRGVLVPCSGHIDRPPRIASLDQHVAILNPDETVLEALRRLHPALSHREAHALLARYAFRNVAAEKPVATLSGGEKLRAGLAAALGGPQPPQLLTLDEPTNHLDLDSIEVLEAALAGYTGAILAASHDTAFLEDIGIDRMLRLESGELVV